MENDKNNNDYNNQNYLGERKIPNQNTEIKNETENKLADSVKENEIKKTENLSEIDLENDQKEIHPEIVKKRDNHTTMFLILAVVVLVLIGVIAAYFLSDAPKKETPQQIIKSAIQEMQKVKSYNYNGVAEFNIKNRESSENFNINMELFGKTDQTDINNIKSSGNIKTALDISTEGGSQKIFFDLDAVQAGQTKTYLKLNDYDLGIIGMMMGSEISSFKGKWYLMDLEELEELESASPDGIGNASAKTYNINSLMEIYGKYDLLKFQEDLGETKLGNNDVYHYKAKLNGAALVNLYLDILREIGPAEKKGFGETNEEMLEQIKEDIKKYDYVINDITNNINVEIWVGKEDRFIYRTKIDGRFDGEFMEMIGNKMLAKGDLSDDEFSQMTEDDFEIVFNVAFDMNNFNKPVEINEPEEKENFMEALTEISGKFLKTEAVETGLDSDMDELPDYLENIYGSDINNPDTDGDGYKDGEEIESGYDPLTAGSAKLNYERLFE